MEILQRLKTKIENLHSSYIKIQEENKQLKEQLANSGSLNDEVTKLKQELAQKDAEIEAIIQKVESLLA